MKRLFAAALMLSTLASTAVAQTQVSATVAATVEADLVLAVEGETNFGSIGNYAHTETIDPAAPTATQTTAQFTATAGSAVVYTWPTQVTLAGPDAATMSFTTTLNTANTADQSTSLTITSADGTQISTSPLYLWLGGSIGVGTNQAPGSYSGVFTLSATYP